MLLLRCFAKLFPCLLLRPPTLPLPWLGGHAAFCRSVSLRRQLLLPLPHLLPTAGLLANCGGYVQQEAAHSLCHPLHRCIAAAVGSAAAQAVVAALHDVLLPARAAQAPKGGIPQRLLAEGISRATHQQRRQLQLGEQRIPQLGWPARRVQRVGAEHDGCNGRQPRAPLPPLLLALLPLIVLLLLLCHGAGHSCPHRVASQHPLAHLGQARQAGSLGKHSLQPGAGSEGKGSGARLLPTIACHWHSWIVGRGLRAVASQVCSGVPWEGEGALVMDQGSAPPAHFMPVAGAFCAH